MEDITIEGIRILFNEQFGIFTIDFFIFSVGTTIGAIGAKLIKFPRISMSQTSNMRDNNARSSSPNSYSMFNQNNYYNGNPPPNNKNDEPPNDENDK